ncbi:MAG: tetratricopeptide repeat protein [Treponema sp.]|jgi:tetratricopeptide (TPR) repeat protein|nr:tetratricopeptide repeat protein [Treponema sp.]
MAGKGEGKKTDPVSGKIPPRGQGALQEGKRLFGLKRWDLALQKLLLVDASAFSSEENTELAYYIGLSYTKIGRYEDGLLYLEQVITTSTDPLRICQCRMTLAYIYVITKRAKLAEFELGQLIKNGIESVQIYTTLAYAAWIQKNNPRAVELYEKALDLDQNNTTALNGLGYILADTNTDLTRGLRLCKRAVDLKPQNAAYLDSLAWAFFQYGDVAEARSWMRRAAELSPQNDEIRSHQKIVFKEGSGK